MSDIMESIMKSGWHVVRNLTDYLLSLRFVRFCLALIMPWLKILLIIIESIVSIVINPSFIIFAILAIGLGTLGIWISFFPTTGSAVIEINSDQSLSNIVANLDNLSVFTFCIAALGNMATDYFFVNDDRKLSEQTSKDVLQQHLAIISWAVSLLCTFWALADDNGITYCLGFTLMLWMAVNVKREKFNKVNKDAFNLLKPEPSISQEDEIKGGGL